MKTIMVPLASALVLSACGGAPASWTGTDTPTDAPSVSTLEGTTSANGFVQRYEGTEAEGHARDIVYNRGDDTLSVDNLPFDGANTPYRHSTIAPKIGGTGVFGATGPFAVYEGPTIFPDTATGDPIDQLTYRAIYGESTNQANGAPRSRFAIVRSGSYSDYGFGGFMYERNGRVTIPVPTNATDVQAAQGVYTGAYAGLVDFDGLGGAAYVSGAAEVSVDFQDFNDGTQTYGDAVRGSITGRRYYSLDGTDITDTWYSTIAHTLDGDTATMVGLPVLRFTISSGGVIDLNGEMEGAATSTATTFVPATYDPDTGELLTEATYTTHDFENGTYYGVLSGDATSSDSEIVGIVVVESPFTPESTARETGGFIVYRGLGN